MESFPLRGRKELPGEFADKIRLCTTNPSPTLAAASELGSITARNAFWGLFTHFLKHQLHLQVFHGRKEIPEIRSWNRWEKKAELAAVVSSARKKEKCGFMFLCVWRGRKVNYPHGKKKKCWVKVQETLIHQQLSEVMVRVGQIKFFLFKTSYFQQAVKSLERIFYLASLAGKPPAKKQIMPFHFKLAHSNVTLTLHIAFQTPLSQMLSHQSGRGLIPPGSLSLTPPA